MGERSEHVRECARLFPARRHRVWKRWSINGGSGFGVTTERLCTFSVWKYCLRLVLSYYQWGTPLRRWNSYRFPPLACVAALGIARMVPRRLPTCPDLVQSSVLRTRCSTARISFGTDNWSRTSPYAGAVEGTGQKSTRSLAPTRTSLGGPKLVIYTRPTMKYICRQNVESSPSACSEQWCVNPTMMTQRPASACTYGENVGIVNAA